ncbi:hypothetical protein HMPREF0262_01419 [Clostridium sp. ATCC 29733]|nr:hypothetical protein HMPREF0262_01419 [Clostridium sp. ATCC 29733]
MSRTEKHTFFDASPYALPFLSFKRRLFSVKHARLTLRHWAGVAGIALTLLLLAGVLWLSPLAAGDEVPLTPEMGTLKAGTTYVVPAGERVSIGSNADAGDCLYPGTITIEKGATLIVRGELVWEEDASLEVEGSVRCEGDGRVLQKLGRLNIRESASIDRLEVSGISAMEADRGAPSSGNTYVSISGGHVGQLNLCAGRLIISGGTVGSLKAQTEVPSCSVGFLLQCQGGEIGTLDIQLPQDPPDELYLAAHVGTLIMRPGDYQLKLTNAARVDQLQLSGGDAGSPRLMGEVGSACSIGALTAAGGGIDGADAITCNQIYLSGDARATGLLTEAEGGVYLAAQGGKQPSFTPSTGAANPLYRRVELTGNAAQAVSLSAPSGKSISGRGDFDGFYCKEGDQVTVTSTGSDPLDITRNNMYLAFSNGSATYTASAGFDQLQVKYAPPLSIGMTHTAGTGRAQYTYDPVTHILILENNCRLSGTVQEDVHIKVTSGAGYIELNKVDRGAHCVTLEPLIRQEGETVGIFIGLDGASHLTALSSSAGPLSLVKEAHAVEDGLLTVDGDLAAAGAISASNIQNLICKKITAPSASLNNCIALCDGMESTNGSINLINGSDLTANGPIVLRSQNENRALSITSSRVNVCAAGETPTQSDRKIVITGNSQVTARALPVKGENIPLPAIATGGDLLLFDGTPLSSGQDRFFYALSSGGAPAVQAGGEIAFSLKTADTPLPTIARPQDGEIIPLEGGGQTFGVGDRPTTDVLVAPAGHFYTLAVDGGSGSDNQLISQPAYLTADPAPEGMAFDRWELVSGEGTFADATAANTAFTASAEATVRALYREAPVEPDPDEPVTPDPDDPVKPDPDEPTPPVPDDPVDPAPPDGGGQTPPTPDPEEGDPSGGNAAPPTQGPEDGASQTGDASALPTWLAILTASLLVAVLCKRHFAGWKHLQR